MSDESVMCRRWVPLLGPTAPGQARGYPPPLYVNRHIVFVVVSRTHVYSITGVSVLPHRAGFVGRETLAEGPVSAVPSVAAAPSGVRNTLNQRVHDILGGLSKAAATAASDRWEFSSSLSRILYSESVDDS